MRHGFGARPKHPLAGKTVTLEIAGVDPDQIHGQQYTIEDWVQNVTGQSWMVMQSNPAALKYAIRSGFSGLLPTDNEVVYGKVGGFGHMIHDSELGEVTT